REATAKQWFATGNADLSDAERRQHPRHTQIVRERKIAVERALITRPAIDTFVIAAVGNGNPQIGNGAAEFVSKGHAELVLNSQHSALGRFTTKLDAAKCELPNAFLRRNR